ncbi:Stabilin-1 [Mizuhopecten yessoensis]|uniref:Stabilin-1 n=1 Tax=Mizuhopecten yessoensis TaxID=6573 RepID=A0A210Q8B4_MIZYE|nr:Stabilin-1 [Mizuhopecten yessoensis]
MQRGTYVFCSGCVVSFVEEYIKAGEGPCNHVTDECTANSTCTGVGGTCNCSEGYYDYGDTCVAKIKAGEGPCYHVTDECTANSTCTGVGGTCHCSEGYYDYGDTCVAKAELSETCGGSVLCDDAMSECIAGNTGENVCRCQLGYFDSNSYSSADGVCTSSAPHAAYEQVAINI